MAEAIVITGVVAAAIQFIDAGYKSVRQVSALISRFKETPQSLEKARFQIHLLLQLAELVSKDRLVQSTSTSTITSSLPTHASSEQPLPLQEVAWKECIHQARLLSQILDPILLETEGSKTQRFWKRISSVQREKAIRQIVDEIECQKSMLTLWYGQECLRNIYTVKEEVGDYGTQLYSLHVEMGQLKSEFRKFRNQQASGTLKCVGNPAEKLPLSQCVQQRSFRKCTLEANTERLHSPAQTYVANNSYRNQVDVWHLSKRFSKFGMLLQYTKHTRSSYTLLSGSSSLAETTVHGQTYVKVGTGIVKIMFKWISSTPSIGISLRAEVRTQQLPLESFFHKLYSVYLFKEETRVSGFHKFISGTPVDEEKQRYLLSVVEKVLLDAFKSGRASPGQVDSRGQTLLHLQILLCSSVHSTFLAKVIRLLLSMGVSPDVEDDDFRTAQALLHKSHWLDIKMPPKLGVQCTPLNQSLLDWTTRVISPELGAIEVLDCVVRWPEAAEDTGYSDILSIVLTRSISRLESYLHDAANLEQNAGTPITPLHFATAACWLEGAEIILSHGLDRYARDPRHQLPLSIAIHLQDDQLVELFLRGDCTPYFTDDDCFQGEILPADFLKAMESNNEGVQDAVVEALARNRRQLQFLTPYHDLARNKKASQAAGKLFSAGFHDIEMYDEKGRTPLICSCYMQNRTLNTFLLRKGADPTKPHRDAQLRPGHFLFFNAREDFCPRKSAGCHDFSFEENAKLLKAAFDSATFVESTCGCSPNGYNPVHSSYRNDMYEGSFVRIQNFMKMIDYLSLKEGELDILWRDFVRVEVFDRLEMTHTCLLRIYPEVRPFPEDDRLEILEEEEELYQRLEEFLSDYDDMKRSFMGEADDFNLMFFDHLDQELEPLQPWYQYPTPVWGENNHDLLGPGEIFQWSYLNSRGKVTRTAHKEGIQESDMLSLLFG